MLKNRVSLGVHSICLDLPGILAKESQVDTVKNLGMELLELSVELSVDLNSTYTMFDDICLFHNTYLYIKMMSSNYIKIRCLYYRDLKRPGGSTPWGRSKSSFLLFLTEGSVNLQIPNAYYQIKNIVFSRSYRILKF